MHHPLIGILGGMGPLASSGFVNFLYQKCRSKFSEEQNYPRIILISDPTIPDRMACVKKSETQKVVVIFEEKIQKLLLLGANRVLICCFTAHYFLKLLTPESQKSVIDLGQLLKKYLDERQKKTLILCSELLATSRLIDSPYAVYPEKKYFDRIHQLIYHIKLNGPTPYKDEMLSFIQTLSALHNVSGVLLACTEFHLIYQELNLAFAHVDEISIVDGLNIAADFIVSGRVR